MTVLEIKDSYERRVVLRENGNAGLFMDSSDDRLDFQLYFNRETDAALGAALTAWADSRGAGR